MQLAFFIWVMKLLRAVAAAAVCFCRGGAFAFFFCIIALLYVAARKLTEVNQTENIWLYISTIHRGI